MDRMPEQMFCDLVIGMGEIGRPLFDVLRMGGYPVVRRDLEEVTFPSPVRALHICYPYSVKFVESVVEYTKKYNPDVVIVHSTVIPGTTRQLSDAGIRCAYSPVRGRHTQMHRDMLLYVKFISAVGGKAETLAKLAMSDILQVRILPAPVETLELSKLLETTYSGLLIAWAQEIQRICDAAGASYDYAWEFFEEIPYLPHRRFVPGIIGGHCIMPNIELLLAMSLAGHPVLDAIIESNRMRTERGDDGKRYVSKELKRWEGE